jgi:hypothetical protein
MEVREFSDPVEFRRFADPLLLVDEARNSLIIGVRGILIDRPEVYDGFHLLCVADGEEPLLAALITPPRNRSSPTLRTLPRRKRSSMH